MNGYTLEDVVVETEKPDKIVLGLRGNFLKLHTFVERDSPRGFAWLLDSCMGVIIVNLQYFSSEEGLPTPQNWVLEFSTKEYPIAAHTCRKSLS